MERTRNARGHDDLLLNLALASTMWARSRHMRSIFSDRESLLIRKIFQACSRGTGRNSDTRFSLQSASHLPALSYYCTTHLPHRQMVWGTTSEVGRRCELAKRLG